MNQEAWKETIFQSYLKKHRPSKTESDHVLDFLRHNPHVKLSTRTSYLSIKDKAHLWTEALNKKNRNQRSAGVVEVVCSLGSGLNLVRLVDQKAKNWEGKHMGHCVASYKKHQGIYSLRDSDNIPHCTIEVDDYDYVTQIKGKGNRSVSPKYHEVLIRALLSLHLTLDSQELENLGLQEINVNQKKYLDMFFEPYPFIQIESYYFLKEVSSLKLKTPLIISDSSLLPIFVKHLVDIEIIRSLFLFGWPKQDKLLEMAINYQNLEVMDLAISYKADLSKINTKIKEGNFRIYDLSEPVILKMFEYLGVGNIALTQDLFEYACLNDFQRVVAAMIPVVRKIYEENNSKNYFIIALAYSLESGNHLNIIKMLIQELSLTDLESGLMLLSDLIKRALQEPELTLLSILVDKGVVIPRSKFSRHKNRQAIINVINKNN